MNDQHRVDEFFQIAVENQELMRSIFVAIPVRPHDGLAIDLSCKLSSWFSVNVPWKPLEDGMQGFIELSRIKIAYDFLHNRDEKFLLMLDNDTEPPIDLPWLLARHDKPIVGSCIVSRNREGRGMLCFSRADCAGISRFVDFEDGDRIPATGLAEVPHCGTGAMMIRRDVLESFTFAQNGEGWDVPFLIPDDIRVRGAIRGALIEGEDIRFCKQARAKGYKIHVDMEAHCGHRKTMKMGFPPLLRDPSMKVEDWIVSQRGMALRNA